MRQVLDDQLEEMNGIFILHAQKIKRMLDLQEHAEKMRERDTACRLAEAENFQLREQLAAMRAVGNQTLIMKPGPIPGTSVPATTGSGGVAGALMPPGVGGASLGPASPVALSPHSPHALAAPLPGTEVLHRLERAQTVLETWATAHHPQLTFRGARSKDSDEESSDSDLELPGAVRHRSRRGDKPGQAEQSENEEEAIDPKAEYLKESQKQRKKKMLNSKLRALDMKTRMRDAFAEPSYVSTEHYHTTGCAQKLARSPWFEHATMTVILLNSVWIGIESTVNESALLINADPGIIAVENLLCVAFTVEIVIRFMAYKSKLRAIRDFWFIYDFFLAFFMVMETWVFFVILTVSGGDLVLFDSSIMRMLRLLRLTRVARIARMLRFLPEVMILVRAIGAALRSVILTVILGLMIVYIFAIALSQIAVDTPAGINYYSTLPQAMFSLIFHGCFNNDLASMARLSFQDDIIVGTLFAVFILIAPLTIMNLLLGVLVEVVRVVATAEQEGRVVRNLKEELHWAKQALGTEGDTITQEEFIMLLQNDQAIGVLQDVGVDLVALVKDPNIIFDGDPYIHFQDFLNEMLLLRGSNNATVKDLTVMKNQLMQSLPNVLKRKLHL
ncbi:CATSPER1 [Symbiodinium pilosum]|uniref:CATSPER1 protein n=1 Tax=Symbiodinium pilosum TaxID=2952 RepID=A0A812WKE1_SYMPI|nr:CATSPER1 [Symbiodinium pilosum]